MKSMIRILSMAVIAMAPVTLVQAQSTPTPATSASPAASATPVARTDVYHVHFTKSALGKAAALADYLKTPDPKAPMPGHFVLLRHQEGDAWDYVVIQHVGPKASVEAAGTQVPAAMRELSDWHNDTFVNGPSWAEFTRAMGIGDDAGSKGKAASAAYVVSVYRPAPGHREQLEKMLGEAPASGNTSAGNVLMQHLEGGPWTFLTIARFNSWQDFATNEINSVTTQASKNPGGWFQLRDHVAFHNDTLTNLIAP